MIRGIFFALQITSLLPGVAVLVLPLGDQAVGIQPIHFTLALALPLLIIALIQGNLRIRERTLILVLLFAFFPPSVLCFIIKSSSCHLLEQLVFRQLANYFIVCSR
jgi:hypothetical protein